MLQSKKITIILSILFAFGLWIYVVGEINPTTEETVSDIPIYFSNESVLRNKKLAVSSISLEKLDLEVKGSRTDISDLKKSDIRATVNLSEVSKGENEVSIDVRVPDGIEVVKKGMSKIIVTVERLKGKNVPIKINYTGNNPNKKEPITVSMSKDTALIQGAESLVDTVKYVQGNIAISKLKKQETLRNVNLLPVDNQGKTVERIDLRPKSIDVTSFIADVKKVKLEVPISDSSENTKNKNIIKPSEIVIMGKEDALHNIKSLTAEPIDITNAKNDETYNIVIKLPEGIRLLTNKDDLVLKVGVDEPKEQNIEFTTKEISLQGRNPNFIYDFEQNLKINVVIKGDKDKIEKVKKNNISIWANVENLFIGHKKVELNVICNIEGVKVSVNPENLSIDVKDKNDKETDNKKD